MKPIVVNDRFNMADTDIYILYGIWPRGAQCLAFLNGSRVEAEFKEWKGFAAADRYELRNSETLETVAVSVRLPNPLSNSLSLSVVAEKDGKKFRWYSCKGSYLIKKGKKIQVFIEQVDRTSDEEVLISGWAASQKPVKIEVYGNNNKPLQARITSDSRADIAGVFPECKIVKDGGFCVRLGKISDSRIKLAFKNEYGSVTEDIPLGGVESFFSAFGEDAAKGLRYLKNYGIGEFSKKVIRKLKKEDRPVEYRQWIRHNFADAAELKRQRQETFENTPLISIVVPLYKTKEVFLDALVDSVKKQTYPNWELCMSDGSGAPSPIEAKLEMLKASDKRIKVIQADKPRRIAQNTNAAIEAAKGDYIAFADHDDVIAPDALYEVVKAINEHDEPELIYTDEDKINGSGGKYYEPNMKPDFNLDLLRTVNYICHLCVIKKELLDKIGPLDEKFDGAQDYELILRAVEKTDRIYHIPKVLYHWRGHEDSTAGNPESKKYAFDAGRRAIAAHYERLGIKAEVISGEWEGLYRTRYIRAYDPFVSIIIPNKDHIDDLDRCVQAILERATYKNYEFVVVENNSEDEKTFEYYKRMEAENPKFRVAYFEGSFNYSKINNFGVENARGEYVLLLNNDTEIINNDCIEEMLGYCMRDDVGAVGARLYYEDETIQHAGVVVGFGGIAGHCFVNQKRGSVTYCHRAVCAQDYSAVTAACMMVDKKVYEKVGGLYEGLAVAFNDIDFCLNVRKAGYLVVYNPYAEMYHYESKSRGYEDTPEKRARFNSEIVTLEERWPEIFKNGDPYYSPNLTLKSQDFSLCKNW